MESNRIKQFSGVRRSRKVENEQSLGSQLILVIAIIILAFIFFVS